MGFIGKFLVFGAGLALLVGAGIGGLWYKLSQPAPIPKLELQYWGPGKAKADDITIKPFKINVSNEVLEDLRDRLDLIPPLTPPLEGANFRYGFNSDYLQKVVQFWQNEYDWRSRETFLNSLPQFSTQIQTKINEIRILEKTFAISINEKIEKRTVLIPKTIEERYNTVQIYLYSMPKTANETIPETSGKPIRKQLPWWNEDCKNTHKLRRCSCTSSTPKPHEAAGVRVLPLAAAARLAGSVREFYELHPAADGGRGRARASCSRWWRRRCRASLPASRAPSRAWAPRRWAFSSSKCVSGFKSFTHSVSIETFKKYRFCLPFFSLNLQTILMF
ncbi:Epoxide hydrolase, partial [Gryllus bimaculatus]